MKRTSWLNLYCVGLGLLGWAWLLASRPFAAPPAIVLFFTMLALLVESAGLRLTVSDAHSLVGVVVLSAALARVWPWKVGERGSSSVGRR